MEAKILSITTLRPKLLQCMNRAHRLGQEYIITKNGKPSAVIMDYDEWETWKETMEILAKPKLLKKIRKNRGYFARGGRGKTIGEVFGS